MTLLLHIVAGSGGLGRSLTACLPSKVNYLLLIMRRNRFEINVHLISDAVRDSNMKSIVS
jgi:hypothetical protein